MFHNLPSVVGVSGIHCIASQVSFVFFNAGNELRGIILGDWGERLLQGQDQVAAGMALWSETNDPAWIITTGDNIYPKGIFSWDDPQMDRKWRNVYYQVTRLTVYLKIIHATVEPNNTPTHRPTYVV